MRILLVEDHERFSEFVCGGLEKVGFTVDVVHNAGDGDAAFNAVDYDAVLLDLGLGGDEGFLDVLRAGDGLEIESGDAVFEDLLVG